MAKYKRLTDQEKIEVVEKYVTGNYNCVELGKIYGIGGGSIRELLLRRGIKVNGNQSQLKRKYNIDESYFEKIDSEDKAYFLGLLYADGCVHKTHIKLKLQDRDIEILNKFNKFLKFDKPLGFEKRRKPHHHDYYIVDIWSKKMAKDLIKLGCIERKSLTLKFPTEEQVPTYLLHHFIRGYFDGDGCFNVSKSYVTPNYNVSLLSTLDFCNSLDEAISHLGIKSAINHFRKNSPNKITHRYDIRNRANAIKFLNWIYNQANVYLDRKYEKYINEKNTYEFWK